MGHKVKSMIFRAVIVALLAIVFMWFFLALRSLFERERWGRMLSAASMTISYRVNGQYKTYTVSKPEDVKGLSSRIRIVETKNRMAVGFHPSGWVTFTLPDGKKMEYMFVRKTWLARLSIDFEGPDNVYLSDTSFYDTICEILSKLEGRPIDVLTTNP